MRQGRPQPASARPPNPWKNRGLPQCKIPLQRLLALAGLPVAWSDGVIVRTIAVTLFRPCVDVPCRPCPVAQPCSGWCRFGGPSCLFLALFLGVVRNQRVPLLHPLQRPARRSCLEHRADPAVWHSGCAAPLGGSFRLRHAQQHRLLRHLAAGCCSPWSSAVRGKGADIPRTVRGGAVPAVLERLD